jgi:hypothetical protein
MGGRAGPSHSFIFLIGPLEILASRFVARAAKNFGGAMEEIPKEQISESQRHDQSPTARWLAILSVLFLAAAVFAAGYAYQQNRAVAELKQKNDAMTSTEAQMSNQIDALSVKIAQMTPPPPSAPAAEAPANAEASGAKSASRRPASAGSGVQNRRLKQMQSQLTEQRKELMQTREDLASARSDLEGKLGSTRDELNGSIARTHEELVGLEKRGERLYYEFDLSKSKSFQREGPIQLSLRKADSKHQSYDLMMLVDDHELSKKKVDLYEPIWLHEGDMPQPVQVVVNRIGKNDIHGYVSAPKYKEAELASFASSQQAGNQVSAPGSTPLSSSPTNNSSTSSSTSATASQGRQNPVD